jgi:hypothetical protein
MNTPTTMRAKLQVGHVQEQVTRINERGEYDPAAAPVKIGENVSFYAVAKNGYDATGLDEDNTYAKMSPGASFNINIANPALFGVFKHGQKFYVDFTEAPDSPKA